MVVEMSQSAATVGGRSAMGSLDEGAFETAEIEVEKLLTQPCVLKSGIADVKPVVYAENKVPCVWS